MYIKEILNRNKTKKGTKIDRIIVQLEVLTGEKNFKIHLPIRQFEFTDRQKSLRVIIPRSFGRQCLSKIVDKAQPAIICINDRNSTTM